MGTLLFGSFFVFLFLSVPIGIALGLSTVMAVLSGKIPMALVVQRMFVGVDSFPLLAIPFFMLAGDLMGAGGVSKRLVRFANLLIGSITGGLAHVATLTAMFFAAISGSSAATCATIGSILLPEMEKLGYRRNYSAACIAASGVVGVVIPPSIPMVVYGVVANASIADIFVGGFGPGILMGLSIMAVNFYYAKKNGYGGVKQDISLKNLLVAFKDSIWGLAMPFIILGGIYGGVFTPTESAAVACLYAFLVGLLIYRELKFRDIPAIFISAAKATAIVLLIIASANLFGWLLTSEKIPQKIAQFFLDFSKNKLIILLWINFVLLIAGCFVNPAGAIIILTPILLPLVTSVGVDPVFFGVMMVANLAVGAVTPPVGLDLFVATAMSKLPFEKVVRASVPYILVLLLDILILTYFEPIIMFIPNLLK